MSQVEYWLRSILIQFGTVMTRPLSFFSRVYISLFILPSLGLLLMGCSKQPEENAAEARLQSNRSETVEVHTSVTAADREALAALKDLVDQRQEKDFRERAYVEYPTQGTGVPDTYEVLVYSMSHGGWGPPVARQLRISIKSDKATVELATQSGIKVCELPRQEVDLLVRELVYGFETQIKPKNPDDYLPRSGGGSSHPTRYTIEIASRDPQGKFHFASEAWELNCHELNWLSQKTDRFMHTWFCTKSFKMLRGCLSPLPVEKQREMIVNELKRLATTLESQTKTEQVAGKKTRLDDNLTSVQTVLFCELALTHGIPESLSLVEKLDQPEVAKKLAIASVADRLPGLIDAISGDDSQLHNWAIDVITEDEKNDPRYAQALLARIEKANTSALWTILFRLRDRTLTPDQITQVKQRWQRETDATATLQLTELLLHQTHEEAYFRRLMSLAKGSTDSSHADMAKLSELAADAIFGYAVRHGKNREEAYRFLLELLDSMPETVQPSSFRYFKLVERLGELGTKADLPRLAKLADHPSGYLSSHAIESITHIDPDLAVRKAHERIAQFANAGKDDNAYNWNVTSHFDLLFWRNDRAAVPIVKRAHAKLQSVEHRYSQYDDPTTLLQYLEAKDTASRLQAAFNFASERRVKGAWLSDVANDLLKSSASAEQCRALKKATIDNDW